MEFGWFHDDEDGLAEINITPLVDVSLVLLIIFMITAPMLVQGASVDLPQTRPMSKLPSGNVFVTVDANGDIYMNDLRDFNNAINAYSNVVNQFSGTDQEAQAQFMIGYIYANILGDKSKAEKNYKSF